MENNSMTPIKDQARIAKSKKAFLDYYKTILEKVSFDYQLFIKEYRKAINNLSPEDSAALDGWLESRRLNA